MKLVETVCYEQLKASGQLPSPKGVALAIVRLLQCDDYQINDLVRLVQSDPAISGELLRFSNAAAFNHSRPIVSLAKAVTTLGAFRVRVLVLALSVLHNNRGGNCHQLDYGRFWSRALATAISAQALAAYAKITPEENFTAGLLCSVGELALASIFPDRYGEIITTTDSVHERLVLEQEAFATDHRELAATLLLEWGLPEVLVTAIYHCEIPEEAGFVEGSRISELTLSLHLAGALADICVAEDCVRWTMLPNLYAKAARLGIGLEELNSMADNITASWLEWGEMLKIQTREITSFADLLASAQPKEQSSTSLQHDKSALLICPQSPESVEMLRHLAVNGYSARQVLNSAEGLAVALETKPDLIVIETSAPGIDGPAFCLALRESPYGQCAYVILVDHHEGADRVLQMLDMGADDFLQHPVTPIALQAKLRGVSRILQLQKELIKERNGLVNSAKEWAGTNRRLVSMAMTDPLTHLSNRRHGLDFLSAEAVFAKTNNLPLACLMIDIDHFKRINDQYGHKTGDAVLVRLAGLLQASARSGDMVFRYGGEEFCMICPGIKLETACAVAERICQKTASQKFYVGEMDIPVTLSIGVAVMLPPNGSEEALIRDADAAMYRAKEAGRNCVKSAPGAR